MDEQGTAPPGNLQLAKNEATAGTQRVLIVRTDRVEPECHAGVRVAREQTGCPAVVPLSLGRIPWRWRASRVEQQVARIIIDRSTIESAAAQLPCRRRPARYAEVGASVLLMIGMKLWTDADIRIWTSIEHFPQGAPSCDVERSQPSADAEILPVVAHDHFVTHDRRRSPKRLALFWMS